LFPLFAARNVDKDQLDRGLVLLGENANCLLHTLNIDYTPQSHILKRLSLVYDHILDCKHMTWNGHGDVVEVKDYWWILLVIYHSFPRITVRNCSLDERRTSLGDGQRYAVLVGLKSGRRVLDTNGYTFVFFLTHEPWPRRWDPPLGGLQQSLVYEVECLVWVG